MDLDTSPRERLLSAADTLMHEQGYEAVGVAELCREANAKKGSFYYFFDSKRDLAIEMLDRSWDRTRSTIFARSLGNPSLGGLDAIEAYGNLLADNLLRIQAGNDAVAGCRFGNFAVEMSVRDEPIRDRIASIFDEMVDVTALAVQRAVDDGDARADLDVREAAHEVVTYMEGLMVMAKSRRDPDLLRSLGDAARRLLA